MAERPVPTDGSIYHIRVQGSLDERWKNWFGGFVMAARESGETLLCGPVSDQAALHGVLGRLNNLGLPLLLVARADCPCSSKKCANHGRCSECAAHEADRGKEPVCLQQRSRWDKQCTALAQAS